MTIATALNIVAATIGFCAAAFFCIGNISNTSKKIIIQSAPYWDFSEPVALALAAQRAQYVTGALLLVISFFLQVLASQASSTNPASLPQCVHTWPCLVIAVLVPTALIAGLLSFGIYRCTKSKINKHLEALKQLSESSLPPK